MNRTSRADASSSRQPGSGEGPFPVKLASASLNLSTYIALYNYGYRNVYELAPLIDLKASVLEFEPPLPR